MLKKKSGIGSYFGDDNSVGNNLKKRTDSNIINQIFEGSDSPNSDTKVKYVDINVDDITPRSINNYSQTRIEKLAKSIQNTGNRMIHPIVVVEAKNLDPDSPVIAKFKENGVDPASLKYVLVAGERRLRAWKLLRQRKSDELKELSENKGIIEQNPFDTITVNILTSEEAKKEEAFYKDSNDEARQLTPIEGILHLQDALSDTVTNEQKRNALIEMYGEENVPESAEQAAKKFTQSKYILYFLEKELGITSWSESTIKTYLSIINNCSKEVIDAILKDEFTAREARNLTKLPHDTQNTLVKMYKNDRKKYQAKIDSYMGKTKVEISEKKKKTRDAYRSLNKFIKVMKKQQTELKEAIAEGGNDELAEVSAQIDLFIATLSKEVKGKI